jgi:hypothetical protein
MEDFEMGQSVVYPAWPESPPAFRHGETKLNGQPGLEGRSRGGGVTAYAVAVAAPAC